MTTALPRLLSLLAIAFAALALAAACGDDDSGEAALPHQSPGTLEPGAYFGRLEEIFADAEDATNDAEATLNETPAGATLDDKVAALQSYLGRVETIFNDAIGRLEGLGAPAAVAEQHDEFIAGVRDSVAAGNELRGDLGEITTDDELDDRLAEFDDEIDAAVETADAACLQLQSIADDQGIEVDLDCED